MSVRCEAEAAECVCNQDAHEGAHTCDCGGSWNYTEHGLIAPVLFPGGRTFAQAIDALFGDDDG